MFLSLGAPESQEMLLNLVIYILVPIFLKKYIVFPCFQIRHSFEKFMFSPLGALPSIEILLTYVVAHLCPMTFPVIYSFPLFHPYERYFGCTPFFVAQHTIMPSRLIELNFDRFVRKQPNEFDSISDKVPALNISYKPQKISPKSQGTVRQLLHDKIRDAYIHPQFITDVVKPLQLEPLYDQEVSRF